MKLNERIIVFGEVEEISNTPPLLASISRVNLNQDSVTFSHYYLLVLHNIVVLRDERHFDWVQ